MTYLKLAESKYSADFTSTISKERMCIYGEHKH